MLIPRDDNRGGDQPNPPSPSPPFPILNIPHQHTFPFFANMYIPRLNPRGVHGDPHIKRPNMDMQLGLTYQQ